MLLFNLAVGCCNFVLNVRNSPGKPVVLEITLGGDVFEIIAYQGIVVDVKRSPIKALVILFLM